MHKKTISLVCLFFCWTFLTDALANGRSADRIPTHVATLIEHERATDSVEAAEVFLLPFRHEIDSVASAYHIPPALIAAIVQEESNFEAFAIRTEPAYLKKRSVINAARAWSKTHHGIPTATTELVLRASSWGLMQPMGQLAREQGFSAKYLSELILPTQSLSQGALLLARLLKRYHQDTLSAISAYNQGSNKRRRGVFVNARYVYRVSVAWKVYQSVFSSSFNYLSTPLSTPNTHVHIRNQNTNDQTNPARFFTNAPLGYPRRNAASRMSERAETDTFTGKLAQNRHRAKSLGSSGLGASKHSTAGPTSASISHPQRTESVPRFFPVTLGLVMVCGLGWLLFRYYRESNSPYATTTVSGHAYDLPEQTDKRVQDVLRRELSTRQNDHSLSRS